MDFTKYGQYKNDIFVKLSFDFTAGKKILDVGCGDCSDAEIFIKEYKLITYGIDIYEHENIKNISGLIFKNAGIYNIPYPDSTFDYVFMHDVLHHIDETGQRYAKHIEALREVKRVCKKGGTVIIIEGNRYNPLFYPHMVKMLGHNHFRQGYFRRITKEVFQNALYKYFEAHVYPQKYLYLWKLYEKVMETVVPKRFLAYNVIVTENL